MNLNSNDKTYWIPEILPDFSDEYNRIQENKKYLTPECQVRKHPLWYYDNNAYVDDEYLFKNEGWKLLIDNPPEEQFLKHISQNEIEKWNNIDENVLEITYTYEDFSQEEIEEFKQKNWNELRDRRNLILLKSDYAYIFAMENGLTVSREWKEYRQKLRDLPNTISDILEFNVYDDSLWPIKPETPYEV